MILLLVLLALCFAWACISTGVAVSLELQLRSATDLAQDQGRLITSLQDRFQASSLSEYHAARQIAMQPADDTPAQEWDYDDTGLIRSPRLLRDDTE